MQNIVAIRVFYQYGRDALDMYQLVYLGPSVFEFSPVINESMNVCTFLFVSTPAKRDY